MWIFIKIFLVTFISLFIGTFLVVGVTHHILFAFSAYRWAQILSCLVGWHEEEYVRVLTTDGFHTTYNRCKWCKNSLPERRISY